MTTEKIIAISGGFDPLHVGHLDYIESAAEMGKVVVILNTDTWLLRKKGYVFMPWGERARILRALPDVYAVIPAEDEDGTVCKTLEKLRPVVFGKGGDRTTENTPELSLCERTGIEVIFALGGGKRQSSSTLVFDAAKRLEL